MCNPGLSPRNEFHPMWKVPRAGLKEWCSKISSFPLTSFSRKHIFSLFFDFFFGSPDVHRSLLLFSLASKEPWVLPRITVELWVRL